MRQGRDGFASHGEDRSEDRCLVFLHVPKTAGRSVTSSLLWNFPGEKRIRMDILDKPLAEEIERIPLERRSTAQLVYGHVPYGVHRHMPQRCEYFTIVREPIGRVISVYKYILRDRQHVLHDRIVGEGVSLEQYLESGMDRGQTENSQTRQLSSRQFGALDRDALEEAKRNLEACLLVGLTERFEETFVLLRRTLGLRMPFYVTTNVSPPFQFSERAAGLVRERNELDLELYESACDLFAEQLRRQKRSFGLEVPAYRVMRPISRVAGGSTERVLRKLYLRLARQKTWR